MGNPTLGQIFSQTIGGVHFTGRNTIWLANFTMQYLPEGLPEYPGSKVWLRQTIAAGVNVGHDYNLVQVVNGNRQKIEPAWSKFATFMNTSEAGWTPGWMWYKSDWPSPSPGAPSMEVQNAGEIRSRLTAFIFAMS